jgi:AhpD family alkylhydroperoxidase
MKRLLKSGLLPTRTKEMIGLLMAGLHKCGY